MELAKTSKVADDILKKVKLGESKTMSNEVTIEEMDKSVREANQYKFHRFFLLLKCLTIQNER